MGQYRWIQQTSNCTNTLLAMFTHRFSQHAQCEKIFHDGLIIICILLMYQLTEGCSFLQCWPWGWLFFINLIDVRSPHPTRPTVLWFSSEGIEVDCSSFMRSISLQSSFLFESAMKFFFFRVYFHIISKIEVYLIECLIILKLTYKTRFTKNKFHCFLSKDKR